MLEFKKGDPNSLKGRAIVYVKGSCEPDSGEKCKVCPRYQNLTDVVLAVYVSNNVTDYIEKMGLFEHGDKIKEAIEKQTREAEKQLGIKLKGKIPFFVAPLPGVSEVDLLISEEDIIYAGEFTSCLNLQLAISGASSLYAANLEEQVKKKHKVEEKAEKPFVKKPTYKDFEGKSIREYITNNFVIPMVDTKLGYISDVDFEFVKNEFMRFSENSLFYSDVIELCEIIGSSQSVINTELTDAYINKLVAIHSEDYTVAGDMKKKIEGILQE